MVNLGNHLTLLCQGVLSTQVRTSAALFDLIILLVKSLTWLCSNVGNLVCLPQVSEDRTMREARAA
jgi:hypothetical protein